MKQKFIEAYMDIAVRISKLSTAKRLQVGAIIVKDDKIISLGYNGTPYGWDNNCEDIMFVTKAESLGYDMLSQGYSETEKGNWTKLKTKDEVLHAESNAIAKLARSNESGEGATMFVTHQPCMECAKLIYQTGIKELYYGHPYRKPQGADFLEKAGVIVWQYDMRES